MQRCESCHELCNRIQITIPNATGGQQTYRVCEDCIYQCDNCLNDVVFHEDFACTECEEYYCYECSYARYARDKTHRVCLHCAQKHISAQLGEKKS